MLEGARPALASKTTTPSQPARTYFVSGRFSTGRSTRGPRNRRFESLDDGVTMPQPATSRGVGEEERRPTAWGGSRPALAAKISTLSPQAFACSVGG